MSALTTYWRGAVSLLARVGVARPAIRALPHAIRSMGVAVPRTQPARRLWTGAGKKGADDEPPAPPAPAPPAEGAAADPTASAAMAADEKLTASDGASAEGGDASDAAAAGAEGAGAESEAKDADSLQSAGECAAATRPTRRLR
jgi:hypothetical protein